MQTRGQRWSSPDILAANTLVTTSNKTQNVQRRDNIIWEKWEKLYIFQSLTWMNQEEYTLLWLYTSTTMHLTSLVCVAPSWIDCSPWRQTGVPSLTSLHSLVIQILKQTVSFIVTSFQGKLSKVSEHCVNCSLMVVPGSSVISLRDIWQCSSSWY